MNGVQPRRVRASSLHGTYNAGVYCTETDQEAIDQARQGYRNSSLGRSLGDLGAFRFYIAGRGMAAYEEAE